MRHRRGRTTFLLSCLLSALSAFSAVNSSSAGDWAEWRGPEQNGVSRERDLPETWSTNPKAEGSNLRWRAPHGGRQP